MPNLVSGKIEIQTITIFFPVSASSNQNAWICIGIQYANETGIIKKWIKQYENRWLVRSAFGPFNACETNSFRQLKS